MKRPADNITPIERAGRMAPGAAAAIAGVDLLFTGALGHCPLYRKLGCTPPSLRRTA